MLNTVTSTSYCSLSGHVRAYAGSIEARPDTCHCGAVRFVRCVCSCCGDWHEKAVSNTEALSPFEPSDALRGVLDLNGGATTF